MMSTPCSPSASPNPRKRACPDGDAEVEIDIQMEVADENGEAVSLSSMSMPYGDPSSSNNKKAKIEVTAEDCSTGESLAGTADKEVVQDQKTSSDQVEEQSGAAPLALDRPPLHAKRKKFTFQEKQVQAQERAEKKAQREEEKRVKDEERRKKEEERRRKEEVKAEEKRRKEGERDERKRTKEEEKRVKGEEKKKKEEERRMREEEKLKKAGAKKDRSQMSLNAFLSRPSTSAARRRTATPDEMVEPAAQPASTSQMPSKTDYQRTFAPFFVKSHVTVAPWNRWSRDEGGMEGSRKMIDECLKAQNNPNRPTRTTVSIISVSDHFPPSKRLARGITLRYAVREIMTKLAESTKALGTAQNPVEIPSPSRHQRHYGPMETELLKSIPMKYLEFYEDVRPPYWGTFTKQPPADVIRSLSRNPTQRKLPNINYDYDTEAVWDPEEEGEDLDSEGEQEEASDDDADDMEGFLDDEDITQASGTVNKRRAVLTDLVPICSGLSWDDGTGIDNGELSDYKMEVILSTARVPINPYATSYWQPVRPGSSSGLDASSNRSTAKNQMNPPRLPLHSISRANMSANGSTSSQANAVAGRTVMVAAGDLVNFKAAIQGSNLTKTGLVEVLKKKFPENSKLAIKNTLNVIAERVGTKEADKRWAIINGA